MKKTELTGLLIIALFATGCVSSHSPQVYRRSQAQQAQTVQYGTVEYVQPVQVEGNRKALGAVAGGVAGGLVGNQIGGGSGKNWATAAGAVAGAAGGAYASEKMTGYNGLEITVKVDGGGSIAVVQSADVPFATGDRVRVLRNPDGTSRISR